MLHWNNCIVISDFICKTVPISRVPHIDWLEEKIPRSKFFKHAKVNTTIDSHALINYFKQLDLFDKNEK